MDRRAFVIGLVIGLVGGWILYQALASSALGLGAGVQVGVER